MSKEIIDGKGWIVKYSNAANNESELINVMAFEKQGHNSWWPLYWNPQLFKIMEVPAALNGKQYIGYFPPGTEF